VIEFLDATIAGLGQGSIYALLALGFVIIYRATRVVSFAQPGLVAFGGWWVVWLVTSNGLPFWLGFPLAILLTGAMGLVIERIAIRPMVGQPVFAIAIITIGVDIVLRVLANDRLGSQIQSVGDPWGLDVWSVGDLIVQHRYVAMIVIAAVTVALLLAFVRFSRFGLGMRAAALDQEAALAQGVSVSAVFAISWAIAGGLAAIAAMLVGTGAGFDQQSALIALKALPAFVVGGLDSIGGALVGGLAIGLIESYSFTYQPQHATWLGANFSDVVPYVVMFIVLLVRPSGLFGTREVQRV
jgi:branched-chain amino acid transport system permease protein